MKALAMAKVGNQDAEKPTTLRKLAGEIAAAIKVVEGSGDLMIRSL